MKFKITSTLLLVTLNIMMALALFVNVYLDRGLEKSASLLSEVNKNNKNYLNSLKIIKKNLQKNKKENIEKLADDFVFDSSTEAILIRETLAKINLKSSDYRVIEEFSSIDVTQDGEIISTQLSYSFDEITYSKIIALLEKINIDEKFNFISSLKILKNNDKNRTFDMQIVLTNIGYSLDN